ncbi:putative N-acetyltransferase YafP [Stieleria neptunia]|uniref:Putative N-acetyltransferase YafP n=1 Tax=Stieleria neptunia TaxID=2527979 RepID=A0A518HUP2_9BACT|nr:GNAT family N-acetyltransferase [Stieleria neptunia]QDV44513.1 putative N-acetyltransferase YafP [Stieleria neptunia]
MNPAAPLQLRPFRPEDAGACLSLFRDCVHRINARDYTQQQLDAWAPATIDQEAWRARFDDRFAYVVVEGDRVVGFTDMTRGGHLDRLFVSADHQGRGIARRLVETLLDDAAANGIDEITTDASLTAKPFFERMGFNVMREQSVECRGVHLTNYPMRRVPNNDLG